MGKEVEAATSLVMGLAEKAVGWMGLRTEVIGWVGLAVGMEVVAWVGLEEVAMEGLAAEDLEDKEELVMEGLVVVD
jgi:hypothetical protein